MTSNISSTKEEILKNWLQLNSKLFLSAGDEILDVVLLTNTILNDPQTSRLGLKLDHKFEIQPKAIFTTTNKDNSKGFGIIEISSTAIGLKDVGILHTYAKMVSPKYALLLCEKSYSKELTYLLTDPRIAPRLLRFEGEKELKLIDYS